MQECGAAAAPRCSFLCKIKGEGMDLELSISEQRIAFIFFRISKIFRKAFVSAPRTGLCGLGRRSSQNVAQESFLKEVGAVADKSELEKYERDINYL